MMGSDSSKNFKQFQDGLWNQTVPVREILSISHAEFLKKLQELNNISMTFIDDNDKRLIFIVKKSSDTTVLWKGTVQIACVKIDNASHKIDSYRLLSLKEFLKVHKTFMCQVGSDFLSPEVNKGDNNATASGDCSTTSPSTFPKSVEAGDVDTNHDCSCGRSTSDYTQQFQMVPKDLDSLHHESKDKTVPKSVEASCDENSSGAASSNVDKFCKKCELKSDHSTWLKKVTASMILESIAGQSEDGNLSECCICLERKPDVILPCTHNYCLPCIEQWNVCHKTCPICRESLNNTDDSWVVSEAPDSAEMAAELSKSLMKLATNKK